jgi:hypothetical protein
MQAHEQTFDKLCSKALVAINEPLRWRGVQMTVADELSRRVKLWEQISAGDASNAEASTLRSMRVYGGAQ